MRREDSVLDEPARELVPLAGVAAIDGETRLSVLVLSILQVTGYFLVHTKGRIMRRSHEVRVIIYHLSKLINVRPKKRVLLLDIELS